MEGSLGFESSQSGINSSNPRGSKIIIGYYNLKGKAQVCRLLCEYLGVDYEDRLFTLAEWQRFSTERTQDWAFSCLPYLREGSFIVTESVPMCVYVINRFGDRQLLGRCLKDRAIVDMYIWTIEYMGNVITINCQQKSPEELRKFKLNQWNANVLPRLLKIEEAASEGTWFLDYLTIIDFSIYELVKYMDNIFDGQTAALPKLKRIEKAVENLDAVRNYERSERAITEWCPTKLLENLKASQAGQGEGKSDSKNDAAGGKEGGKEKQGK